MSIASNVGSHRQHEPADPGASREVKVWDVSTRLFHWFIVALVAAGWATGEEEGTAFVIHSLAGYALLAALLFRLVWGFIGGAYARFSSFVRPWSVVAPYARELAKLKPQRFVGHNPLGGWMIVLLLACLALVVVSGMFAGGEEGLAGPWASAAVGWSAQQWYEVHEVSFNVLLVLIVVHIAGVVVDQLLTKDKLVRAMFTGRKRVRAEEKVLEATPAGSIKALAVLAAAVITTGFMVGWQWPSGAATHAEQGEQKHEPQYEREHD